MPSSSFLSKYLRYARGSGRGRAGYSQSTSTRWGTANDTEYPTALGHCGGLLPAYARPRAARARARRCNGACRRTQGCLRTQTGRRGSGAAGARTQTHGVGLRAGRAHRDCSKLRADSESGIVPFSSLEEKSLRLAWFVPLCSEMLMHRSVPRTHTSTARGGRMGLRPRGYWTRVLEGCCTRALFVPGRRKVLQPCRSAHTPSMVLVRLLERSLATHMHGPVLRGYAHGGGRGTCAVLAHKASRSALSEYARTTARTARRRR